MNICLFGDSITWEGYDPKGERWATRLRNHCEQKYPEVLVYNLGICGDNSAGLVRRITMEAQPRTPDVIVVAIGANDVVHEPGKQANAEGFLKNIEKILIQAVEATSRVIVLGITPVDERLTAPSQWSPFFYRENKDISRFNQILKEAAGKRGLVFVPIPEDFSISNLEDGLHPNSQGHQKIFEAIMPALELVIEIKKEDKKV